MDTIYEIADILVSIGFIFGPTSGYYFQYKLIKDTESLGTFSIDVCAILIFSNLLRILFWCCKRFDDALLYQSIVMIAVQLLLLRECIRVKSKSFPITKFDMSKKFKVDNFWRWDDFRSYLDFSGLGFAFFIVLTLMLSSSNLYIETIGSVSVMIEACLGLPQLLANRKNRSTDGLSMGLILTWFTGDLAKTLFFILKNQPLQFVMCGITQLSIDIYIIYQIYTYGRKESKENTRNWYELMPRHMSMHHIISVDDYDYPNKDNSKRSSLIWY